MDDKVMSLLNKVDELLKQEGIDTQNKNIDSKTMLSEYLLPGLKNSKDVLSSLYSFQTRKRTGVIGKIKSFIQNKLANSTINVIEKQAIQQQKFNELVYKTLELLVTEQK